MAELAVVRGRKRGQGHDEHEKHNIKLGRYVSLYKKAKRQVATVIENVVQPDFRKRCAELAFARDGNVMEQEDRRTLVEGTATVAPKKRRTDSSRLSAQKRGTVSYVRAQAGGAANLIQPQVHDDMRNQLVLGTALFDEASMWLQQPKPEKDDQCSARGKTVHLPCLNISQHIFVTRSVASTSEEPATYHTRLQWVSKIKGS